MISSIHGIHPIHISTPPFHPCIHTRCATLEGFAGTLSAACGRVAGGPCLAIFTFLQSEHPCARFWHAWVSILWGSGVSQPCLTVLHRAFPWYWPVHLEIYGFAFYALYALYCLLFSSSEDAISRPSLRTLRAPPWAWILLGMRCFATMPQCSTGLFHGTGRSIETSITLPSMPCMPCIAFCLAVPKMLFRDHLCASFGHRLGLESCWGCGVSQPCRTVSTGLLHGTGRYIQSHPVIDGCTAFCLAVPKMLFRDHLCASFWHRLGLESCWGWGVSQPCRTVLHTAFPWYWPVHPVIYGLERGAEPKNS